LEAIDHLLLIEKRGKTLNANARERTQTGTASSVKELSRLGRANTEHFSDAIRYMG
jgi:hypothetical protein